MWTYAAGLLVVLMALTLAGILLESRAEARDRIRYQAPGTLVPLAGRRLHLHAQGERRPGGPLVVLEAGMAGWSFYWRLVQPVVAREARVCSYDRAGLGWSDPAPGPRSAVQLAEELHAVLQAAGEPGPYVLVGHSLGGILVRQFAAQYPGEVAGMVLVDSAHEDQLARLPWAREESAQLMATFRVLAWLRRLGVLRLLAGPLLARFPSVETPDDKSLFRAVVLMSRYFETTRDECRLLLEPVAPRDRLASLGERPLVVVRAGAQPPASGSKQARERALEARRVFDEVQQELLCLSTNSRLVVAEKSVHTVQVEEPEVVIAAIRQVLERVRDGDRIAEPRGS